MICARCGQPFAPKRLDARFCSKRCRQNAWKFERLAVARERAASPLQVAYADPPYPGKAHLYRDHPDYAGEVDHGELLERLATYDGWALSTSSAALPRVCYLAIQHGLHPKVASWHRGARVVDSGDPLDAWEPVLYVPARRLEPDHDRLNVLDHVARPRYTDPNHVIGAKPAAFCHWLFHLLGARLGDTFHDLFRGSGGVARAWEDHCTASLPLDQLPLPVLPRPPR